MKILIISLPRTGSNSLLNKIAYEFNLQPISEPFYKNKTNAYKSSYDGVVVKTIISQKPDYVTNIHEWLIEFTKEFDKVILLSRKDLKACAESLAFFLHNESIGFDSVTPYSWYETPNYLETEKLVKQLNDDLNKLSKELNIDIVYYEDIFNTNSPERLRKNNVGKTKTHLI
jgi:hypothetical protein